MTVIAAIFSSSCIALASDSFITELQSDGKLRVIESEQSKIVPIRELRAAVSYWGLASWGNWSTFEWLKSQASRGARSLGDFAERLREDLEKELSRLTLSPQQRGIGIHLTGYEQVDGFWIPELFLCSTFRGTDYATVGALELGRHTVPYVDDKVLKGDYGKAGPRLAVRKALQNGLMLRFNNGDPTLFNPIADSVFTSFEILLSRGLAGAPDKWETFRDMVKRPVEIVSKMQHDFCRDGQRVVGGKTHDLVILPTGEFYSSSGDCP